jgi:hypothetical protein
LKKVVKSFFEVLLFFWAAFPAVRYTSLAGRHGYYGCGGLVPFRLLALVAVACRLRAVSLPSGAENQCEE